MGMLCSMEVCGLEGADPLNGLWRKVIRPKRDIYSLNDLGPRKFRLKGKTYRRRDYHLVNSRGHRLECSYFFPSSKKSNVKEVLPCVVYLHGATSSRQEALFLRSFLLPRGMTLFAIDQSGCGLSEGDFISFGHYEEQDLQMVLAHLRDSGLVSRLAVWGRSMGAAATVLRAAKDSSLSACVLDSPFSSLPVAVSELASKSLRGVPTTLLDMTIRRISAEIKANAGFDLADVLPIDGAPSASAPVLFAVGEVDDIVRPYHVEALYEAWGCSDRRLVQLPGGHNSPRPIDFVEDACEFLQTRLVDTIVTQGPHANEQCSSVKACLDPEAPACEGDRPSAPVIRQAGQSATSTRCSL